MDIKSSLSELVRLMTAGERSAQVGETASDETLTAVILAAEDVLGTLADRAVVPEDVLDGLSEETRRAIIGAYAREIRMRTHGFRNFIRRE